MLRLNRLGLHEEAGSLSSDDDHIQVVLRCIMP